MDEVRRTADIGSFILSEKALDIIIEFEYKINDTDQIESWQDYLHHEFETTDEYMKKFIEEAKRDISQ